MMNKESCITDYFSTKIHNKSDFKIEKGGGDKKKYIRKRKRDVSFLPTDFLEHRRILADRSLTGTATTTHIKSIL